MPPAIPIIYTPTAQRQVLGPAGRVVALVVSLACLAVLLVAVMLPPSPSGEGTHTQMGLQKCEWLQRVGVPCPTCGMTTSFAWFVRGNWLASFYVQPMAFVLALLTGGLFWAGLYMAITANPLQRLLKPLPMNKILVAMVAFGIAAWGWKIFIYVHGIDGWH